MRPGEKDLLCSIHYLKEGKINIKHTRKRSWKDSTYRSEARKIWLQHYLSIPKDFIIHHIDGNPLNNNILNLEAVSYAQHGRRHSELNRSKPRVKQRVYGTEVNDIAWALM